MATGQLGAPIKRALTAEDFYTWVNAAKPGERLEYHRGVLASDIGKFGNDELSRLARMADLASSAGNIILVQRRYGEDDYSYVAVKIKRRWS